MAVTDFELTGAWDQFRASLDPAKFRARERSAIRVANEVNGMYVAGQVKRAIRSGGWSQNAPLTTLIKGSTKPLSDHGQLMQAITHKVVDWKTVFVGVSKQAKTKSGRPLANVALALHEGISIIVTRRMRSMFWYLWLATTGRMKEEKLRGRAREIYDRVGRKRIIKPLSPATTAIRIPGRPFLRKVFDDKSVQIVVKRNWARAVDQAMKA